MAEQTPPSRPTSANAPPVRPKSARGRREWIAYNQTPATASQHEAESGQRSASAAGSSRQPQVAQGPAPLAEGQETPLVSGEAGSSPPDEKWLNEYSMRVGIEKQYVKEHWKTVRGALSKIMDHLFTVLLRNHKMLIEGVGDEQQKDVIQQRVKDIAAQLERLKVIIRKKEGWKFQDMRGAPQTPDPSKTNAAQRPRLLPRGSRSSGGNSRGFNAGSVDRPTSDNPPILIVSRKQYLRETLGMTGNISDEDAAATFNQAAENIQSSSTGRRHYAGRPLPQLPTGENFQSSSTGKRHYAGRPLPQLPAGATQRRSMSGANTLDASTVGMAGSLSSPGPGYGARHQSLSGPNTLDASTAGMAGSLTSPGRAASGSYDDPEFTDAASVFDSPKGGTTGSNSYGRPQSLSGPNTLDASTAGMAGSLTSPGRAASGSYDEPEVTDDAPVFDSPRGETTRSKTSGGSVVSKDDSIYAVPTASKGAGRSFFSQSSGGTGSSQVSGAPSAAGSSHTGSGSRLYSVRSGSGSGKIYEYRPQEEQRKFEQRLRPSDATRRFSEGDGAARRIAGSRRSPNPSYSSLSNWSGDVNSMRMSPARSIATGLTANTNARSLDTDPDSLSYRTGRASASSGVPSSASLDTLYGMRYRQPPPPPSPTGSLKTVMSADSQAWMDQYCKEFGVPREKLEDFLWGRIALLEKFLPYKRQCATDQEDADRIKEMEQEILDIKSILGCESMVSAQSMISANSMMSPWEDASDPEEASV